MKMIFTRAIAALTRGYKKSRKHVYFITDIFDVNEIFDIFGIPHNFCQNL